MGCHAMNSIFQGIKDFVSTKCKLRVRANANLCVDEMQRADLSVCQFLHRFVFDTDPF